jgi:3-phosphoshikimate 1-carboxyvinyltransferase
MITTIQPSKLKGMIPAPVSKSSMQRACAAALLHAGETIIHHPGHSNDDKAALGVIRDLGAGMETLEDGSLRILSKGLGGGADISRGAAASGDQEAVFSAPPLEVNCGESGLGIRMFAPIIALSGRPVIVRGEGSLLSRPMDFFDTVFPQLGIRVVSNKGRLPLEIQGPLLPRSIEIDGSLSSQFLTGLLFSFAAAGAKGVSIRVNNLKSRPYIDLTLLVLRHFGWNVENRNYKEFYFPGLEVGPGALLASEGARVEYTAEGDWSGSAFLLVAGAIAGPVTIRGLEVSSTQADKAILQALQDCGVLLSIGAGRIEVGPPAAGPTGMPAVLKAFQFNATDCPDLFPPLVALATCCEGTTVLEGVSRLAHKESNRGLTLQEEFAKMGIVIQLVGDRMLIRGGEGMKGASVHSRHDHRIAMACAVAALRAEGPTTIEEAQAIDKSYPDFYGHLQQLGATVSIRRAVGNEH